MSSDPFQSSEPFPPSPRDPAASPFAPSGAPNPESGPVQTVAVQPLAVRPRRAGAGMLVNVLLGVAVLVAVGGVAFAVGRATAPVAAAATGRNGFGGQGNFGGQGGAGPNASGAPGRGQGFGGFGGGLSVQGTVEAIDGSSLTVKLANGTSVTFALNGDTSYHKRAAATAADVTSGSTVIVQLQGGRGFNPGGQGGPAASGAPAAGFGTAGSVTVVPPGG